YCNKMSISNLPKDILWKIFILLDIPDIENLCKIRRYKHLSTDVYFWKEKLKNDYSLEYFTTDKLQNLEDIKCLYYHFYILDLERQAHTIRKSYKKDPNYPEETSEHIELIENIVEYIQNEKFSSAKGLVITSKYIC